MIFQAHGFHFGGVVKKGPELIRLPSGWRVYAAAARLKLGSLHLRLGGSA